jgi:hypothetical protein
MSARARDAFGTNYDRLRKLKTIYDPTNRFRRNQNIAPDAQKPDDLNVSKLHLPGTCLASYPVMSATRKCSQNAKMHFS